MSNTDEPKLILLYRRWPGVTIYRYPDCQAYAPRPKDEFREACIRDIKFKPEGKKAARALKKEHGIGKPTFQQVAIKAGWMLEGADPWPTKRIFVKFVTGYKAGCHVYETMNKRYGSKPEGFIFCWVAVDEFDDAALSAFQMEIEDKLREDPHSPKNAEFQRIHADVERILVMFGKSEPAAQSEPDDDLIHRYDRENKKDVWTRGHTSTIVDELDSQNLGEPVSIPNYPPDDTPRAEPHDTPEGGGNHQSKEMPWDDNAEGYIFLSKAIKMSDGKVTLSQLSKKLEPGWVIRYMRKGQRCKVHVNDFDLFLTSMGDKTGPLFDAIDDHVAGIEKRKAEADAAKPHNLE